MITKNVGVREKGEYVMGPRSLAGERSISETWGGGPENGGDDVLIWEMYLPC